MIDYLASVLLDLRAELPIVVVVDVSYKSGVPSPRLAPVNQIPDSEEQTVL
jgi:hypothetical protein